MTAPNLTHAVPDGAVLIRDVGPRDGLQSIDADVSVATKIAMVEGLAAAGIRRVEVGSFVSPKAVPQMADSGDVFAATANLAGALREALVVNERGAHAAIDAGADVLVSVVSVSETFSQRNVRMTTGEALVEMAKVVGIAGVAGVPTSINLSASFGCVRRTSRTERRGRRRRIAGRNRRDRIAPGGHDRCGVAVRRPGRRLGGA